MYRASPREDRLGQIGDVQGVCVFERGQSEPVVQSSAADRARLRLKAGIVEKRAVSRR